MNINFRSVLLLLLQTLIMFHSKGQQTTNYIPKYNSTPPNTINSVIFESLGGKIGINNPSPLYEMDVVGAINCTNAYWLNSSYILKDNGVITNVHVGHNSGLGFIGGGDNTTVGYFSGGSVSGYGNVCVGSNAGIGVGVCDGNTMVDLT